MKENTILNKEQQKQSYAQEIISQIKTHKHENEYGEPKAIICFPNGRHLEVVVLDASTRGAKYYYWQVICSNEDEEKGLFRWRYRNKNDQ